MYSENIKKDQPEKPLPLPEAAQKVQPITKVETAKELNQKKKQREADKKYRDQVDRERGKGRNIDIQA